MAVVRTFRTDAVNDILHLQNLESLRNVNLGDSFVLEAIGLAAYGAGEVDVFAGFVMMAMSVLDAAAFVILAIVVAAVVFATDAVFLLA